MKEQILKHYNKADIEQIKAGKSWYEDAHLETLLISEVFNIQHNVVIGVLAALSPRNKWRRNVADTWALCEKPCPSVKVCTFNSNKEKALRILSLIDPTNEDILEILKGVKVSNFFKNIMFYNETQGVTVDVWAFRSVGLESSPKNYRLTEEAYIEASKDTNLMPHELQAVVWGVVRGELA